MSVCIFIAADCPLPEVKPLIDYSLHINLDSGIIDDGGADDNYFLFQFDEVGIYSKKKYGVFLEWAQYTEGRAKQILSYIKSIVRQTGSAELWNVFLTSEWEFDDRPFIHSKSIHMDELTVKDIQEINDAENWNNKDKNRPSFYCIEIMK